MKHSSLKRLLAVFLAVSMLLSLGLSNAYASQSGDTSPLSYEKLDSSSITPEWKNTEGQINAASASALHQDTDLVRAIIVLDEPAAISALEKPVDGFADNKAVVAYRQELQSVQDQLADRISDVVLDGEPLEVVWNLTLAANSMSVWVEYGKLSEIEQMPGVRDVYLETQYQPLSSANPSNIVAQEMTGADQVQQDSGYTGAGTRIAIIDTGTDTDHQSFSEDGFLFSLARQAEKKGMDGKAYFESLDLLTVEQIKKVLGQLHAAERYEGLTAESLYLNAKLPFAFNYVDGNLEITHDHDDQGEHGSHVAGISAANAYIPTDDINIYDFNGDGMFNQADAQALMDYVVQGAKISSAAYADLSGNGSVSAFDVQLLLELLQEFKENKRIYAPAAQTVGVTGSAPDAQLITMKVFGANGGAYASDYMVAVEDAIALGCDVVNLSLGSPYPGFTSAHEMDPTYDTAYFDGLMQLITKTGTVMCVAGGNSGNWADYDDAYQHMYTDEAGTAMVSDPSTYANALAIASVDNIGIISSSTTVFTNAQGEQGRKTNIEGLEDGVDAQWRTLDPKGKGTDYDVVFLGDPSNLLAGKEQTDNRIYGGSLDDFAGFDFTGKIVLIARGNEVYHSDKHTNGMLAGAAAVLIYNNVPGALSASLEGSEATIPCGGLTLEDAKAIFALSTRNTTGQYLCKATITNVLDVEYNENTAYPTMSDFSSWGTTGGLTIKPELTAPGGGIYSVDGSGAETDAYKNMSGTSMATPHVSGLVALASQYIRESGLLEKARAMTGNKDLPTRVLAQSLLMSTADPLMEESSGVEYSVRNQGAGLANINHAVNAETFVLVDGQSDGKVKAELGDGETGWTFSFSLYNLTEASLTYDLDASILTTDTIVAQDGEKTHTLSADEMVALGAEVTYFGDTVSQGQVSVPAGGSAKITVHIQVTEKAVANMKALGYANGFYVEGFVYAKPVPNAEGVTGVTHSIPLLGWYGNWTDPSMFDTGSFLETIYGTAQRPSHIDSTIKNVLTWNQKGNDTGIYYTGNIYGGYTASTGLLGDQHYFEERNAFNSTSSRTWNFYAIFPTAIRNAADILIQVRDADTGKLYFEDDFEDFDDYLISSFYQDLAGQWVDTTSEYGIGIEWDYTDRETGMPLPEGTRVTVSLFCAPEYYVNEDGSVRWDELGHGADLSYTFTVDNTAPALAGGRDALTISKDGKTLYFQAQDDNYIAAVVLLNGAVNQATGYFYPDMPVEQKGTAVTGSFDVSKYTEKYGNKAVLAVCDYAGNETYYAVNLGGADASYGDLYGFQYDPDTMQNAWVGFSEGVNGNESTLFAGSQEFVCAEYVDGYIYAQTSSGELHAIPYADLLAETLDLNTTLITRLENVYQDLAYNYSDGKLYGLLYNAEYTSTEIDAIALEPDEENGVEAYEESWVSSRDGFTGLSLACNDSGTLYILGTTQDQETGNDSNALLYKTSPRDDDYEGYGPMILVGDTGLKMDYLQSMTWDHNTETMYWARFYPVSWITQESTLERVDPETAACTRVGTLSNETACLFAPLGAEAAAAQAHQNVPVLDSSVVGKPVLSNGGLSLNVGGSASLYCTFDPWYTEKREVIWTSSDPEVATVDQNGLVTGVSTGSCTITVASKADPSLTATCAVSVASLSLTIDGVTSVTQGGIGSNNGSYLYHYTMDQGKSAMTLGNPITAPEEFSGFGLSIGSTTEAKGSIWACEYGNAGMIYEIDKQTGVISDMVGPIDGDVMFGMTYSEATGNFTGIMNYYLYVDQPFTHEADEQILGSYDEEVHGFTWHRFDMAQYLNASQRNLVTQEEGTTSIVFSAITSVDGGEQQYPYQDYLGNWMSTEVFYTPNTTLILLDNVGRLWYIDEITGMTKDSYGNYQNGDENMIGAGANGVFAQDYVDEDGNTTYNVFYIREIVETPLYDMFLNGTLPGITYHFSDMYYTQSENGTPMFFLSLYDYWNEGATNQLYLYIPGDEAQGVSDQLFDLGDTGHGNIITTINHAELTGGLDAIDGNRASQEVNPLRPLQRGFYTHS